MEFKEQIDFYVKMKGYDKAKEVMSYIKGIDIFRMEYDEPEAHPKKEPMYFAFVGYKDIFINMGSNDEFDFELYEPLTEKYEEEVPGLHKTLVKMGEDFIPCYERNCPERVFEDDLPRGYSGRLLVKNNREIKRLYRCNLEGMGAIFEMTNGLGYMIDMECPENVFVLRAEEAREFIEGLNMVDDGSKTPHNLIKKLELLALTLPADNLRRDVIFTPNEYL